MLAHKRTLEAFFHLLFSGINCTESVLVFLKYLVEFGSDLSALKLSQFSLSLFPILR